MHTYICDACRLPSEYHLQCTSDHPLPPRSAAVSLHAHMHIICHPLVELLSDGLPVSCFITVVKE